MSTDPPQNKPSTLISFINSSFGKIIIFVTFVTAIFTAFKSLGGDTRLAIIVLFVIGTGTLLLGSLYVLLRKNEIRTTTFKTGLKLQRQFAYTKGQRRAALAILIITSISLGIGFLYKKRTPFGEINLIEALIGKKVNVQGFVSTAGGEPADKALVTLFLNEKLLETKEAAGGTFSFTGLDISKLYSGTLRIEVKWKTLETNLNINLPTDQLNNLVIKLPPGPPPFRVEYFVLQGPAIDFLVSGQINKQWEERLGGQPTIVVNDVFHALKDLLDRFSAPLQYEVFEISNSKAKSKSNPIVDEQLATQNQNRLFFLGGWKGYSFFETPTKEELISLLSPSQKWHLIITPRKSGDLEEDVLPNVAADSFFFWRFATADDAKMLLQGEEIRPEGRKKAAEFYSYITRDYLPPDFFLFTLRPDDGDPCDSPTRVVLSTRPLKLRIVVLENISNDPIRIGKFSIRGNNSNRLRSRDEDSTTLAAKPLEQKVFHPSEFLRPKEKLVIPIELLLANDRDEKPWVKPSKTPPEILGELSKVDTINLPVGYLNMHQAPVSTSVLINMIKTPAENPKSEKEFVFGTTLKIESLDVDGVNYPFRPLDTSVLVMNGGISSGSCPYVFTYASESNLWVNEGTILTGLDKKWKESTDEKELTRFDGSILLREADPEVSFIDKIYIRALSYNGSQRILSPKNYQLRYGDGNYLVLKQGDQKRIDFNVPQGLGAKRFILVAKGYYIPYPQRK